MIRTSYKLYGHESAQAHIEIERYEIDGRERGIKAIRFISYATDVCGFEDDHGLFKLYVTGTYSATTLRQISWFFNIARDTRLMNYYTVKVLMADYNPEKRRAERYMNQLEIDQMKEIYTRLEGFGTRSHEYI